MTTAILFLDGADFKVLRNSRSSGSIEINSIDSGRNFSMYLTGKRPVENGVLLKDLFYDGENVETVFRDHINMNMKRSDFNTALIQEKLSEEGYRVGSFYVPGSYPELDVEVCKTDSFEDFPPLVEDVEKIMKQDKSILDLDLFELSKSIRERTYEVKDEVIGYSDDLDVVFVYFGFTDLLHHCYLSGISDQMVGKIFSDFKDYFDQVLMISDHTINYRDSRRAPAKHSTPAKYISTLDSAGGAVKPVEVPDLIREHL